MDGPEATEPTDETLVEAVQAGDSRALDTLLRRHESRVLRVLRLLGVRPSDRDDLAQEVFIRVFRHLSGFRRGRTFAGWLYRIAVNVAHDHRRRTATRRQDEAEWPSGAENLADSAPGPEELAALQDRRDRLERALEALSERERAVFVLCELELVPTREAAKVLGITSITVRRHLGRARLHLIEILKEGPLLR